MEKTTSTLTQTVSHPLLWIGAIAVLVIIAVQSVIYLRAAKSAAVKVGMSGTEVNTAFRAGGISAIGPSIAVCLVALALLPLFGTPSTITRLGLIGSAAYETIAANLALGVMGTGLGEPNVDGNMLVTMLLALAIGGSGWMVVTLIMTPIMKRGMGEGTTTKTARKRSASWALLPTAALLGAFFTLGLKEFAASSDAAIVFVTSAGVMLLLTLVAQWLNKPMLREFALGAAMIVAIAVGYFIS